MLAGMQRRGALATLSTPTAAEHSWNTDSIPLENKKFQCQDAARTVRGTGRRCIAEFPHVFYLCYEAAPEPSPVAAVFGANVCYFGFPIVKGLCIQLNQSDRIMWLLQNRWQCLKLIWEDII